MTDQETNNRAVEIQDELRKAFEAGNRGRGASGGAFDLVAYYIAKLEQRLSRLENPT